jgi:DNA-binding transcriptional MerR regulator
VIDLFSIGDFSRATHLSVKALRHYHDVGLLVPTEVDPATGYRSYSVAQVPAAQVIRRLRDLDMPLDQVGAVLDASSAGDPAERDRVILAHLARMEAQLEQTQTAVASLRTLLEGAPSGLRVEIRSVGPTRALAIPGAVAWDSVEEWLSDSFGALHAVLAASGQAAAGPDGALYSSEFFELHAGEVIAFVPVAADPGGVGSADLIEIPPAELAVTLHHGPFDDLDRTYAALGSFVAERAIGSAGPIRERYVVTTDDCAEPSDLRTEVGWPVTPGGAPGGGLH